MTPKRLTPAAEELVSLAGTVSNSFAEASEKVLPKMAAMKLSESSVQRTSESAGHRLGALLKEKKVLGGPTPWRHGTKTRGKTCAMWALMRRACRSKGLVAVLRKGACRTWRWCSIRCRICPRDVRTRRRQRPVMQARYLAGLYDLEELGSQMRRQAGQVGMNQAEQWIGLSDGGNGLENFMRVNFPRDVVLILDFWHASEYLSDLTKALHPDDEESRNDLLTSWCQTMKQKGGQGIVAVLDTLLLPPRTPSVQAQYETTLNYIRNNLHRMDYPTYVANGWSIGSGSVESACKTVVNQRLKLAGMRWSEDGTDEMCHLRAMFRSEATQWNLFWSRSACG